MQLLLTKGKKPALMEIIIQSSRKKKEQISFLRYTELNLPVLLMMHLFTNDASYLKIRIIGNMHVRKCNPNNLYQYLTF